jgi:Transglutaminase-like superfamily
MPRLTFSSDQQAHKSLPERAQNRRSLLIAQAYGRLIRFDVYLARRNFAALHQKIRAHRVARQAQVPGMVERVCSAMDLACIWYWKEVLCLQRSAATTCLLRDYGIPAEMVVGAQQLPFQAHAWVEVAGRVVNDRPYVPDIYTVLDRC